eukprot:7380857-Prymnesium_polylepis.1
MAAIRLTVPTNGAAAKVEQSTERLFDADQLTVALWKARMDGDAHILPETLAKVCERSLPVLRVKLAEVAVVKHAAQRVIQLALMDALDIL